MYVEEAHVHFYYTPHEVTYLRVGRMIYHEERVSL